MTNDKLRRPTFRRYQQIYKKIVEITQNYIDIECSIEGIRY